MPPTWKAYGVDANRDGLKDPYNPVDAIFAAARYLRAAGAETDIRRAIFAYNHADWYVDSVLMRARLIGGLPSDFVGSLTGLTQGRFPVDAKATYAGQVEKRDTKRKTGRRQRRARRRERPATAVGSRSSRAAARPWSPSTTAASCARVRPSGSASYIQLQDTYGNNYTYGRLGSVPKTYPAPKPRKTTKAKIARELKLPGRRRQAVGPPLRDRPQRRSSRPSPRATRRSRRTKPRAVRAQADAVLPAAAPAKQRLFANPSRPNAMAAGGAAQLAGADLRPVRDPAPIGLNAKRLRTKPLKKGSRIVAGTILGRIGKAPSQGPHVLLRAPPGRPGRAAGRSEADPRRLEAARVDRDLPRQGKNPFFGAMPTAPRSARSC